MKTLLLTKQEVKDLSNGVSKKFEDIKFTEFKYIKEANTSIRNIEFTFKGTKFTIERASDMEWLNNFEDFFNPEENPEWFTAKEI